MLFKAVKHKRYQKGLFARPSIQEKLHFPLSIVDIFTKHNLINIKRHQYCGKGESSKLYNCIPGKKEINKIFRRYKMFAFLPNKSYTNRLDVAGDNVKSDLLRRVIPRQCTELG